MLRTEKPWKLFEKIMVVHGARHAEDLAYTAELESYEASHTGRFVLIQSLTREDKKGVLRGRIPTLLENGSLETSAGCQMTVENSSVLLCGNPAMLDEMEAQLGLRGMKRHRSKSPGQIVLERYW